MLSKEASLFLKRYPPFSMLDGPSLSRFVEGLVMELYPAGAFITRQGEHQSGDLRIVKEGRVRIMAQTSEGQENVIDFREMGETFGFLSLGGNPTLDVSVQAVADTVCYKAPRETAIRLLNEQPHLSDYLLPSYFQKRDETSQASSEYRYSQPLGAERVLFTTSVRDLAVRDIVTAGRESSIIDAAKLMSTHRISALVITDNSGRPEGIITSSDLRDRVLACGKDLSAPVSDIMSRQLVMAEGSDLCFDALLKMMGHDLHHLLVTESGRLTGIVSNHDFLVLQGVSPLLVIREIENQSSIEGIAKASDRIRGLIYLLLREGAGARGIIRTISAVNDRIERKILDIAVQTLGDPPVPFCWIVYGSAGRKEQTFRTDQDNAIIYADSSDEAEKAASEEYFRRFTEFSVSAFLRCGFKLCPGDFMATNPLWRQPIGSWKKSFSSWIESPTDKAIHNSVNLFDFRGLYGDMSLAVKLKEHLLQTLKNRPMFLKAIADLTAEYRPPIGLFGSIIFEKSGEHVNLLNIKDKCLTPLINIVRLFSFESSIPETSTLERISVLKDIHPVMREVGDDLEEAFEFISMIRIRHQLEQAELGIEQDNFINPRQMGALEFRSLKASCSLVSNLIEDMARKYGTGTRL